MHDFKEIDSMTLYEYELRMKAHRLMEVDEEYKLHRLAWANYNVQATERKGKDKIVPVYKTFQQFYDYEKRIDSVLAGSRNRQQEARLIKTAVRVQEYERRRCLGNL